MDELGCRYEVLSEGYVEGEFPFYLDPGIRPKNGDDGAHDFVPVFDGLVGQQFVLLIDLNIRNGFDIEPWLCAFGMGDGCEALKHNPVFVFVGQALKDGKWIEVRAILPLIRLNLFYEPPEPRINSP